MLNLNQHILGRSVGVSLLIAIAGCTQPSATPPQASRPTLAPAPERFGNAPVSSVNRGLTPNEMVWHLRAGLNVAALSCRGKGRVDVAPAYNRMLAVHKATLGVAYRTEEGRFGAGRAGLKALDNHQTGIYNFFATPRAPELFCRTASSVAGRINDMPSERLTASAPRLLAELESPLL